MPRVNILLIRTTPVRSYAGVTCATEIRDGILLALARCNYRTRCDHSLRWCIVGGQTWEWLGKRMLPVVRKPYLLCTSVGFGSRFLCLCNQPLPWDAAVGWLRGAELPSCISPIRSKLRRADRSASCHHLPRLPC